MTAAALLWTMTGLVPASHAGPVDLPQHLLPAPPQEQLTPVDLRGPRPVNCTPAVIVGAATMVASAAVFARGFVDDDKALKSGGAIGETIGAAILIFGVSRDTCL